MQDLNMSDDCQRFADILTNILKTKTQTSTFSEDCFNKILQQDQGQAVTVTVSLTAKTKMHPLLDN